MRLLGEEQSAIRNPRTRSSRCGLPDVSKDEDDRLSQRHDHLQRPQLPRRLQQQSRGPQIREQRYEHPTIQLHSPPLLAAQFHGRVYLVFAVRRGEDH